MNGELIPFLLKLLEDPLSECDKPSATKALIAESLKNMAKDLANGERVSDIHNNINDFKTMLCSYTVHF